MGRKIFVSYKYGDPDVRALPNRLLGTTARHYVDELQVILADEDHINKGEEDGLDLSAFKDETIAAKLRDKIYDSSLTIVMVSRGMKASTDEAEQWIPWEVSYSLREVERNGRKKLANAMLAIVLPDAAGSYDYYIADESCPTCQCRTLRTHALFGILAVNMFNIRQPSYFDCARHATDSKVFRGEPSYIHSVKWVDFVTSPDTYIDKAYTIYANIDHYNIVKQF